MGIRISEMEEATTFGADDYVPIVTNGTNKKALGSKIKDFIAGFFVNKSGDTMTGDLNINSNNARTKYINPNMTLDTSANNGLSSDSSYGAYFTDKNGNAVGDVSMTTRSTGQNYAQLMARNKKTDGTSVANHIDVIANKDGSSSYNVSNPAAFRSAIEACASDKSLAISFFCSYPNGKEYGSNNTAITIPCFNPLNVSKSVSEAYVYDSSGNYTDIKSTITSCQASVNGFIVRFTFNSNHVGKLLRLVIY